MTTVRPSISPFPSTTKFKTDNQALHLNSVLVTPKIIKYLIYIWKFTMNNKFTIEIDEFGFYMSDFLTLKTLFRCDNSQDLFHATPSVQLLIYPPAYRCGTNTLVSQCSCPSVLISSCFFYILIKTIWNCHVIQVNFDNIYVFHFLVQTLSFLIFLMPILNCESHLLLVRVA